MKLHRSDARVFVPDGAPIPEALGRITHLGIGAHQDDLEFMAFHGILACHHHPEKWFGGVTCTNGAGSARSGNYARLSHAEMQALREKEQETAATLGAYGVMIQLAHPSDVIKNPDDSPLKDDLLEILSATRPDVVYTHNPADKHDSHIAVVIAALQALRELPEENRPRAVHGCEGWRGLDWMQDRDKILHDVSAREDLAIALNRVFDSQIAGGKRYDLATLGRRHANATFLDSHSTDKYGMLSFAMDLTPLVADPSLDIIDHVLGHIRRFEDDVREKLSRQLGRK